MTQEEAILTERILARGGKLGDCYLRSAECVLRGGTGYTLVHGRPTLAEPPHIEYGHAWVEVALAPEVVVCLDGGDPTGVSAIPREVYYGIGQIDPAKCHRYTREDLCRKLIEFEHWGPWDGPHGCPPLARENDDADEDQ